MFFWTHLYLILFSSPLVPDLMPDEWYPPQKTIFHNLKFLSSLLELICCYFLMPGVLPSNFVSLHSLRLRALMALSQPPQTSRAGRAIEASASKIRFVYLPFGLFVTDALCCIDCLDLNSAPKLSIFSHFPRVTSKSKYINMFPNLRLISFTNFVSSYGVWCFPDEYVHIIQYVT